MFHFYFSSKFDMQVSKLLNYAKLSGYISQTAQV